MTSGEFRSIPVDQIIVPPDRQRKDVGDLSDLIESIRDLGVIHPPVIHLHPCIGARLSAPGP